MPRHAAGGAMREELDRKRGAVSRRWIPNNNARSLPWVGALFIADRVVLPRLVRGAAAKSLPTAAVPFTPGHAVLQQ
ncbi:MAG TPA: hypothetical protein VNU95_04190 [Candidatus Acidoferrales bacterium]|nr:hypothetical protein [Candidatus Acidoferrales bacterium]